MQYPDNETTTTAIAAADAPNTERRRYQSPTLTLEGSISHLTQNILRGYLVSTDY